MQLLAHELDTLTVQDIQEWDRRTEIERDMYADFDFFQLIISLHCSRIINVVDKSNLTDERINRLR